MIDRACNDPRCGCSTGVHGGMTFGRGKLDQNGFWEFPCRPCAEEHDARHAETVALVGDDLIACGHTLEEVVEYVEAAEWIHTPAWPLS